MEVLKKKYNINQKYKNKKKIMVNQKLLIFLDK